MATAEIGALRVVLSMDAGQFESGSQKAGKSLSAMEKAAANAAKVIGVSFTAAVAAMAYAAKQAIDFADEIGKMSQRVGIGTETLSGLAHASDLAGLNLQGLDGALDRFNKTIAESARFGSDAAQAFNALGIAVAGRNTEAILLDVADRFAGFADGANKSALAMQLFGRAGADLLPLLNQGRAGIEASTEEARRFGIVISAEAAKKAEDFNDAITRLQAVMRGLATDVGLLAAGPMTALINALREFIELNREAMGTAGAWARHFLDLGALQHATDEWERMGRAVRDLHEHRQKILKDGTVEDLREIETQLRHATAAMAAAYEKMNEIRSGRSQIGPWQTTVTPALPEAPNVEAIKTALELIRQQLDETRARLGGTQQSLLFSYLYGTDGSPAAITDEFLSAMARVDEAVGAGAITAQQAGRQKRDLALQEQGHITSTARLAASTLTTVFADNKAAASAAAAINTAVGITEALKLPPPFSWAQAGLIAAAGAAQIATINSTSKSGGGNSPSVSGGSASGGSGEGAAAPEAPSRSLFIQGVDPAAMFSGQQLEGLIEAINGEVQNGATLISTRNVRT